MPKNKSKIVNEQLYQIRFRFKFTTVVSALLCGDFISLHQIDLFICIRFILPKKEQTQCQPKSKLYPKTIEIVQDNDDNLIDFLLFSTQFVTYANQYVDYYYCFQFLYE